MNLLKKKECIAMLLAGGQGSRLGQLTKRLAKPAVPFGGKYRIIDFPLSNCYNSGIDTVGVLTQYQPLILNAYIGIGSPWDLDRKYGGVTLLPPFVRDKGGEWYKGTANSIYQNIGFIDLYQPEYVLILSGDHIYKMDYSLMLNYHKEKAAEVTIAVIEVPWDEASRFGILNTDATDRINEFEEKPQNPKSNLASMGIYIFNWSLLKKYLREDELDPHSSNDFGKNIIPKMIANSQRVYAYRFHGYWKDVGTVDSLWEAHMDLLTDEPPLDLHDKEWCIYSVNLAQPPHFISSDAKICNSLINEGCVVMGTVQQTVLFQGVSVGKNSVIEESVIMPNVKIGEGVKLYRAIVCGDTVVQDGCQIGVDKTGEITVLGEHMVVASNTIIPSGATVNIKNLNKYTGEI